MIFKLDPKIDHKNSENSENRYLAIPGGSKKEGK